MGLTLHVEPVGREQVRRIGDYELVAYRFRLTPQPPAAELEAGVGHKSIAKSYLSILQASELSGLSPRVLRSLIQNRSASEEAVV